MIIPAKHSKIPKKCSKLICSFKIKILPKRETVKKRDIATGNATLNLNRDKIIIQNTKPNTYNTKPTKKIGLNMI